MAKSKTQRGQHGIMLVRRIFGIYDEVLATLDNNRSGDAGEACFVNLMIKGTNVRVIFYATEVKWKFSKPHHDPQYGSSKYSNTASETMDKLVSNIVKHIKG